MSNLASLPFDEMVEKLKRITQYIVFTLEENEAPEDESELAHRLAVELSISRPDARYAITYALSHRHVKSKVTNSHVMICLPEW
jgi:hypothetical protein